MSNIISADPSPAILKEENFNVDQDDPIRAQVAEISIIFDPLMLAQEILKKQEHTCVAMAAGCAGMPSSLSGVSDGLFVTVAEPCAKHAEVPKGIDKEILARVWRISEEEARRTIEVNTQLNCQGAESSLSRRAGTNDRMLWYRRLSSMFFMDTFFITKKANSTRGYTIMQIFISD